MPSSIFKSICAATAFLASLPTASAAIGNWDIKYQSIDTNFTQGGTNDITLGYHIGHGRDWNVTLFSDDGCSVPIDMTVDWTNLVTVNATEIYDRVDIMLQLDKTDLTSSNIWDETANTLELCVLFELKEKDAGSVMKFE